VSYGTFQLSSNTGGVQAFLKRYESTPQVRKLLAAGPINSDAFKQTWVQLGNTDPAFAKMQADYNRETYLQPTLSRLKSSGIDLSNRGFGVLSVVDATADQYGQAGASNTIAAALKGQDLSKMSDKDIITAIEDYKIKTVGSHFRSSSASVQQSVANRFATEKEVAIKLSENSPQVASKESGVQTASKAGLSPETKAPQTLAGSKKMIPEPVRVSSAQTTAQTPVKAAVSTPVSVQSPAITTPVSYSPSSAVPTAAVDQGQSPGLGQLHAKMADVSKTLSDSLSVQQKMLEALLLISSNTGLLKTLSESIKPAVQQTAAQTRQPMPSPSVGLARAI
jgi:hypothetical protein